VSLKTINVVQDASQNSPTRANFPHNFFFFNIYVLVYTPYS
jgi:hypothetical protein